MKLKSFVMVAMTGIVATSFTYLTPAIAADMPSNAADSSMAMPNNADMQNGMPSQSDMTNSVGADANSLDDKMMNSLNTAPRGDSNDASDLMNSNSDATGMSSSMGSDATGMSSSMGNDSNSMTDSMNNDSASMNNSMSSDATSMNNSMSNSTDVGTPDTATGDDDY